MPNTLIFVDMPTDDTESAADFYRNVFGWEVEPRPAGVFYRCVPGGYFAGPDGNDSEVGNLHLGIYNVANARPHPDPAGVEPRHLSRDGRSLRLWILVDDNDSEDAILQRAADNGAEILWRHHYWKEFNGYSGAFRDPWGTDVVLWSKGGDNPQLPEGYTGE